MPEARLGNDIHARSNLQKDTKMGRMDGTSVLSRHLIASGLLWPTNGVELEPFLSVVQPSSLKVRSLMMGDLVPVDLLIFLLLVEQARLHSAVTHHARHYLMLIGLRARC